MSYNGSGTYIPPAGQPVATGTVIQSSSFNTLVTDIGNTFNNVLPRDGQASMAGQLKLTDGTSSVPGIAFNSEASTGIFRPTTGMLALVAQGVENLRINSAGRVLIGTTTDDGTNKLQVNGATKVTGALAVAGTLNVTGTSTAGSYNGPLTGNVSGNVTGSVTGNVSGTAANVTGIVAVANGGTGAITAANALVNLGAAPLANPTFTGTVAGITATMVGLGNVSNTSDANKLVSTAQQTALNLKSNLASPSFTGGITSTSGSTTVRGIRVIGAGPSQGTIGFGSTDDAYRISAGNDYVGMVFDAGNKFAFQVSGTEAARIASTGNLLLGTTTDNGVDKLQVGGNATISGVLSATGSGAGIQEYLRVVNPYAVPGINTGVAIKLGYLGVGYGTRIVSGGDPTAAYPGYLAFERGIGSSSYAESARISAAGNFIVGSTSDNGTKLQVNGEASFGSVRNYATGSWQFNNYGGGDTELVQRNGGSMNFYTGSTALAMRIMAAGNVLIGTATDNGTDKLQIAGKTAFVGPAVSGTTASWKNGSDGVRGTGYLYSDGGGAGVGDMSANFGNGLYWNTTLGYACLQTGGVERLTVKATGNVLIGTTTDNGIDKLQVAGSVKATGLITGGGGAFNGSNVPSSGVSMELLHDGTTGVVQSYSRTAGAYKALGIYGLSLAFGTGPSATEAVRIDSTGNLLVGTTTPVWSTAGRGLIEINGSATALLGLKIGGAAGAYIHHDGSSLTMSNQLSGNLYFSTSAGIRLTITAAGVIQDAAGNELGYKDAVQNIQGAAYTLAVGDRGKSIVMNAASSAMTIPASVFSGGAVVTIYNNSGVVQSIVQGAGLTMKYGTGASPLTGNRTLANNGICTLYFINATNASLSGNGLA